MPYIESMVNSFMKKYVCMKEDCDFCSADEEDAYEHAHQGRGHIVVEVDMIEDEDPTCHRLDIPILAEEQFEEEPQ